MLDLEFMRLAFGAGIVVGLLAPAVGFFLVQRRLSLIGDGIGHVAFAGVAIGYLLDLPLVLTALVVSVVGALSIEALRSRRGAAGDQALALVFYTGIAAGVVLVSAAGALNVNLFAFLFGSILTVTHGDLVVIASLGAAALGTIALLYRALVAVVVDEEGARVAGMPVGTLNALTAALAAVTIAVSMRVVGILLIAALMVLPVVAAGRIAWSMRSTLLLSMAIGLGFGPRRHHDCVLRRPAARRDDGARRRRSRPLLGAARGAAALATGFPHLLDGRARFLVYLAAALRGIDRDGLGLVDRRLAHLELLALLHDRARLIELATQVVCPRIRAGGRQQAAGGGGVRTRRARPRLPPRRPGVA